MESVAPESVGMATIPSAAPEVETSNIEDQKREAAQYLKKLLPELETTSDDIRRCFGVIIENFHAAHRLLVAVEKKGGFDETVLEFRQAAAEFGDTIERVATMSRQIEVATNEMVKGARDLVPVES